MSCPHGFQRFDLCEQCSYTLPTVSALSAHFARLQGSDTPSGPEKNSGHPATAGPPNNKEIA